MEIGNDVLGIPDDILIQLDAADKRNGFPPGTMQSIMQQEVGGQFDKFLGNPSAHHFEKDSSGKRRAPNGKVSSAFGPFGILKSTAKDPGFGIKPLSEKDHGDISKQIDFAAAYLKGRTGKGDLATGLAKYGEGEQYASQVLNRIGFNTNFPKQQTSNTPIPRNTPVRPQQAAPIRSSQDFKPLPQRRPNRASKQQFELGTPTQQQGVLSALDGLGQHRINQARNEELQQAQLQQQNTPTEAFSLLAQPSDNRQAVQNRLRQIQGTEVIL